MQRTTRLTGMPQAPQQALRKVPLQVSQAQTDSIPAYVPQPEDPEVEGLLRGLSQLNPRLEAYVKDANEEADAKATMDRTAGAEPQDEGARYLKTYYAVDSFVKGQEDGNDLLTKYDSEFDKDKGNLEQWLGEKYGEKVSGIQDTEYINSYAKAMLPALQTIRKEHLGYQQKATVARVEANTMKMVDNWVRPFVTSGSGVPAGHIDTLQRTVGKDLGVTEGRFQELLFASVKTLGDDGYFDAFDVLKQDRTDGSPGLYNDPAWRSKIDAAEAHSHSVFEARSKRVKDERYNGILYDVFSLDDPAASSAKFKELKAQGLFVGDTESLLKWEKLLTEKVDGKPDITQLSNEGGILSRIYRGSVSYEDVLQAEARHDIVSSQRKYLLSEIRRVSTEERTAASAEGKKEEAIYKSREFSSAMDYVEGLLKPRPQSPDAMDKAEVEFDHAQLAQARREFFTASAGKTTAELQDVADNVVKRYMNRRKAASDGGLTPEQKRATARAEVPFKTLEEVRRALANNTISTEEARLYRRTLTEGQ